MHFVSLPATFSSTCPCPQAGGFLSDRYLNAPAREAKLDTMSKAKYGTQLKEMGGWTYMQDTLQVRRQDWEQGG